MKKPPESTAKKPGKRSELTAWLERERPEIIGEKELARIRDALAPVSDSYLRRLLRESGVELAPMVAGVRQTNFSELEASLLALLGEYLSADATRRVDVRRIVIAAKDHTKWAARKDPAKDEMVLWMLTWLENPPVFPEWAKLRRERL